MIEDFINSLPDLVDKVKVEFATELVNVARDNTPVRTGQMRDSWQVEVAEDIVIRNTAPHAGFVEYGTVKMAPRAPLGRAIAQAPQLLEAVVRRNSNGT